MGGAGDSPAPVGDPPTGSSLCHVAKRLSHYLEPLFPFRPAVAGWNRRVACATWKLFSKHAPK